MYTFFSYVNVLYSVVFRVKFDLKKKYNILSECIPSFSEAKMKCHRNIDLKFL